MKKVLLIVADSLMYQAIDEGIRRNALPTLQLLIHNGRFFRDLVSSFPTMSVTIDSTLLTGAYPDEHRVPGLIWYCTEESRLVNYGTGPMEILRQDVHRVLIDVLRHLNGKHLNPGTPTLYEELARAGRTSGSVNGLIYRGNTDHVLSLPPYLRTLFSLPKEIEVKGPDLLAFGALCSPFQDKQGLSDGLWRKLGFNDRYAVQTVARLIRAGQLPDFLYVYLSDMDQRLHRKGPPDVEGAIRLDGHLRSLLEAFGSVEQALRQAVIILTGDSGVSAIQPAQANPVIHLPELLKPFRLLKPGSVADGNTELVLAVNETMAYVYTLTNTAELSLSLLAERLTSDARVDLAAWPDEDWVCVRRAGYAQELRFRPSGDWSDDYNQCWSLQGDLRVMDLTERPDQRLHYGEYPDGFRRLWGALHSHTGRYLIVTAKEGYELAGHSSPVHRGGGGHGSLSRADSLAPLIISGTDASPEHRRMVDLKRFLLRLVLNP